MKISVIPADQTIVVDGEALTFAFDYFPASLRAIQWEGVSGSKEYATGPNQWFDNFAEVQPYLDAYNAEAARLAAEGGV